METYKRTTIDPRAFVILDDCLFDGAWTRDKMMRLLFMNGRHWKIMLVITMQYPLGIPPMLRTNIPLFGLQHMNHQNKQPNVLYFGEKHVLPPFFGLFGELPFP